jgi:TfoX/Sxy family transcriptional regulator of competence genes
MSTKHSTIDYILSQTVRLDNVSAKKMFGEYALYLNSQVVGLVCDDQLFIKPTISGRRLISENDFVEAPPYPGAKMYYLISADLWEDYEWLINLIKVTAEELNSKK